MPYLLNLVYLLLLIAASPWLVMSALRKGKYRQGLAQKLWGHVPVRVGNRPCVWIHAVSLGEVSLIGPLVAELARRHPDWEVVISSTTLTGYTLAKTRYADHSVFYAPLDFSWAVRTAMRRVRPRLLVLAELELWPNLIAAARREGAAVAIVNGRLSDRSFRGYARWRALIAPVLRQVDLVAAQDPLYADRFCQIGARPETVRVTGSLKYDGAPTDRQNPNTQRLRRLAGFAPDDCVFLAGSTQDPEERLAVETYRALSAEHQSLRLVIVPRHPDRFGEVAQMLAHSGLAWTRRSDLDSGQCNSAARILLVDRVGELAAWWGTAQIAFVGGSMGKRNGQNMIEPAAYGAAVSFGPMTRNFRDVVAQLLRADAAVVVRDGEQLTAFVARALADPGYAFQLGEQARAVVMSQLGATARTVDLLEGLMQTSVCVPDARCAA